MVTVKESWYALASFEKQGGKCEGESGREVTREQTKVIQVSEVLLAIFCKELICFSLVWTARWEIQGKVSLRGRKSRRK